MNTSANRKADELRLQSWSIISNIHRRLARYDVAEQMLQRALDHALNTFDVVDEQTTSIFDELGSLYKQMGKLEKAEMF
jgi:tetratricopeptide (TPR) repeat protein